MMDKIIKTRLFDIILIICLTASVSAAVCSGFVLEDMSGKSIGIFCLIVVISGLVTWQLGRTRAGTVAMFIIGTLIHSGAAFLQFPEPIWAFILFEVAVFVQFVYRNYTISIGMSQLGKVNRPRYFAQCVALMLAAALLATGIWAAVVRPLDPPTQQLKLITALQRFQLMEVLGVYTTRTVFDDQLAAQQQAEDQRITTQKGDEKDDSNEGQDDSSLQNDQDDESTVSQSTSDYSAISYNLQHRWWLLLLLIPCAIGGAYCWKRASRRKWQAAVDALSPEDAVINYYRFFMRRFKKLGIKKPENVTLRQFAEDAAFRMENFVTEGVTFADLTAVYERIVYGGGSVHELAATREEAPGDGERKVSGSEPVNGSEIALFRTFYKGFYRGLKLELGTPKYILFYFRY